MRIFESSYQFDYSWEEVSTGNWRKYCPWNDKSTHIVAVDTIARRIDPETGILRTERLITCRQSAPKWLQPFLGGKEYSHVHETSYVDPQNKRVTMCSQNMTWSDLISVQETVTYTPTQGQPQKTNFEQYAKITALCGGWQKIRNSIEQFTVERFGQNAAKGREGFECVLEMSRRAFAQERELMSRRQEEARL